MGYDDCHFCLKVKYVKKKCEHWYCKNCEKKFNLKHICFHCENYKNSKKIKETRKF